MGKFYFCNKFMLQKFSISFFFNLTEFIFEIKTTTKKRKINQTLNLVAISYKLLKQINLEINN